jgi:murein L,D-transpeptidase YafK
LVTDLKLDRRRILQGAAAASLLAPLAGARAARAASWAEGENALRILVMKSERRLVLTRAGKTLLHFPIALGANPRGPKRAAGDGRTPEGTYHIDAFNPASRYYKALHISYPNDEDLALARTAGKPPGGNLEIHGMPPGFEDYDPARFTRDWTDGCIGISNRAVDLLWKSVGLDTPVTIRA